MRINQQAESVRLAFDTLRQHKLRSFLTVLGVVMGVSVLMLVAALITGFDSTIIQAITRFGADTVSVNRFRQGPRIGGQQRPKEERTRKPLTLEDGLALVECCPAVQQVTVWITVWEQTHKARYQGNEVALVDLRGTLANYPFVLANTNMIEGRFFTDTENAHRESVVVLGQDTASALFGPLPATGKQVLVDGQPYRVIGVLARPEGNFGPNDEDRRVLLPYQTFRKAYPGSYENAYRLQAREGQIDQAVDQVRDFLRRRRNVPRNEPDSFEILTAAQQIQEFHNIVGMVAVAMVVLSSIGLLIGGVGVMNIMLVSVTERTREIGVRKALGARRRDIAWQFISEAMALTGTGGVIGVLLIELLVLMIRTLTSIRAAVPAWAVASGVGVSLGVGLAFGVWPAMRAAALDPVDALRYE